MSWSLYPCTIRKRDIIIKTNFVQPYPNIHRAALVLLCKPSPITPTTGNVFCSTNQHSLFTLSTNSLKWL